MTPRFAFFEQTQASTNYQFQDDLNEPNPLLRLFHELMEFRLFHELTVLRLLNELTLLRLLNELSPF